jgi:hypothetical protein
MGEEKVDYDDPVVEANWIKERREEVLQYLEIEGVIHGGVGEDPDYCCAPHASIWRVMNNIHPERIGLWAICGDLPTDIVSSDDARDVREVLAHFSRSWSEVAACMKAGKKHPTITIGPAEKWKELAPILEERTRILAAIAGDDSLWEEEEEE